ncbi:MAG TPA: MarR family winged helix-turn-helix transcriptional regulator [Bryobacteraceae bacterium]
MERRSETQTETLPELACACASIRRAARAVTQLYGDSLKGRLEASQFGLLAVLSKQPGCSQAVLVKSLAIDKTTLSRNLTLMKRNGWIGHGAAKDRRERGFELTPAGRELLAAAKPDWKRAQERLRSAMTGKEWDAMWNVFRAVTRAAQEGRRA